MRRMLFKVRFLSLVVFAMFAGVWPMAAQAATTVPAGSPPRMGAALLSFAVLGAATVTNTGNTVITGNLGVSPGTAVTGFPPGTFTTGGAIHSNDSVAQQAHADLATAYADAAAAAPTSNLTGQDLGTLGHSLRPGVYKFNTSAQLTGTLTLSGNGVYIFQIGSTITTASASQVLLTKGAQACAVFWQVGSSATLGTSTSFVGNILANTSITVTKSVAIDGRALAGAVEITGAVTLDTNHITRPTGTCTSAPGSCKQGEGNDDNAGSAEAARKDSARHDDDDASGTADCDSDDSDQDNSDKDNSDKDNSDKHNSSQGDSNQGNSNEGNSTKADTTKANTTKANATKANTTKANTTKANTTKANATHSNDSRDGGESGSQGG